MNSYRIQICWDFEATITDEEETEMCAFHHIDAHCQTVHPTPTWQKASMIPKYLENDLLNTFHIILHNTSKAPAVQQLAGLQKQEKEGLPSPASCAC